MSGVKELATSIYTILHTWNLSDQKDSFREVQINNDSTFFLVSISENNYELSKFSKNSDLLFSYSDAINQDESLSGINVLSDTTYIIYGQKLGEMSDNLFFRNKSTVNSIQHPTSDLDITNFAIKQNSSSTPLVFEGTIGVNLINHESLPIYNSTAYTNFYMPADNFLGTTTISILSIEGLDSLEEGEFTQSLRASISNDFENFIIEIPGANYKFNVAENSYRGVDFLLATAEKNDLLPKDLFPNPSSDFVHIPSETSKVLIYDSNAKLICKESNLKNNRKVDISSLSIGLYYFILMDNQDNMQVGKVIKE